MIEISETEFKKMQNSCDKVQRATSKKHKQVREIKPTRRSISGVYAFKGKHGIPFESSLERDFIIRHELSRHVLEIIPQPVQISYKGNCGRNLKYTPDFLVLYRFDCNHWKHVLLPKLVEVKPRSVLRKNWAKLKPKFKAAFKYAREQSYEFRIYDEHRIHDQVFNNVKFLERYKKLQFPKEETDWIVSNVDFMGQAPFSYILTRHFQGDIYVATGIAHIWHLVSTGVLACDMTRPLTASTELWVAHDE